MGALDGLKRFAGTRNGKIALGGSAVGGVVIAGLVTRRRAGGDPAVTYAPPFPLVSGEGAGSGVNLDVPGSGGLDPYSFQELVYGIGRLADLWEERANQLPPNTGGENPAPAPAKPVASAPAGSITITKGNQTLAQIAQKYYGNANHASYIVYLNTTLGKAWADLSKPDSKIVLPLEIGGTKRSG